MVEPITDPDKETLVTFNDKEYIMSRIRSMEKSITIIEEEQDNIAACVSEIKGLLYLERD